MGNTPTYLQKIRNLLNSSLVGYYSTVYDGVDVSGNNRHGTPTNLTAVSGIGDGLLAGAFAGDGKLVFPAGFRTAFGLNEGSVFMFVKIAASQWGDGNNEAFFSIQTSTSNDILINKSSASQSFWVRHNDGSAVYNINVPAMLFPTPLWFHVCASWSVSGDALDLYINGYKITTNTGLANLGGDVNAYTQLGLFAAASYPFTGSIAHFGAVNRKLTDTEASKLITMFATPKRIFVLGDSISAWAVSNWSTIAIAGYPYSYGTSRAVSGASFMGATKLSVQTAAAASDDADIIIIECGTNDDNAGDMGAFQTEVEANIAALKLSNTKATIYFMNILPQWANNTDGAEQDNSNLRTAIAAACTAQGITCWDTYTTPWIAQNETLDGLHPTTAGHAKIAAEVLALLP